MGSIRAYRRCYGGVAAVLLAVWGSGPAAAWTPDPDLLIRYADELATALVPGKAGDRAVAKWRMPVVVGVRGRTADGWDGAMADIVNEFAKQLHHPIGMARLGAGAEGAPRANLEVFLTDDVVATARGAARATLSRLQKASGGKPPVEDVLTYIGAHRPTCFFHAGIHEGEIVGAAIIADTKVKPLGLRICLAAALTRNLGLFGRPMTVPSILTQPTQQVLPNAYEVEVLNMIYDRKIPYGMEREAFVGFVKASYPTY